MEDWPMRQPLKMSTLALTSAALLLAYTAHAGLAPEQACQKGLYDAAAKYAQCHQKVIGKLFAFLINDSPGPLSKCRVKYAATWTKLQAKASGTGSTCDQGRFSVSAGTVTDYLTGLQWERKTDDASVHDKDNQYSWCARVGTNPFICDNGPVADGTAFTSFRDAERGMFRGPV
jgi:hypothetical protein